MASNSNENFFSLIFYFKKWYFKLELIKKTEIKKFLTIKIHILTQLDKIFVS